jgi:hypothetical protein
VSAGVFLVAEVGSVPSPRKGRMVFAHAKEVGPIRAGGKRIAPRPTPTKPALTGAELPATFPLFEFTPR